MYQSTQPAYVALYGEVLATLMPIRDGEGVIGIVTQEMLDRKNISIDSLGNELVNDYLRSVKAKYVVLLKETPEGGYRMSFRSKDEAYDMRPLAGKFGGGGHRLASGAYTDSHRLEEILDIFKSHAFSESIE